MNDQPKTPQKQGPDAPAAPAGAADLGQTPPASSTGNAAENPQKSKEKPVEIGGPKGPEPTRFGDWERKGRCIDF